MRFFVFKRVRLRSCGQNVVELSNTRSKGDICVKNFIRRYFNFMITLQNETYYADWNTVYAISCVYYADLSTFDFGRIVQQPRDLRALHFLKGKVQQAGNLSSVKVSDRNISQAGDLCATRVLGGKIKKPCNLSAVLFSYCSIPKTGKVCPACVPQG